MKTIHEHYREFQREVRTTLRDGLRLVAERQSGRSWAQIAERHAQTVAEVASLATECYWGVEPTPLTDQTRSASYLPPM